MPALPDKSEAQSRAPISAPRCWGCQTLCHPSAASLQRGLSVLLLLLVQHCRHTEFSGQFSGQRCKPRWCYPWKNDEIESLQLECLWFSSLPWLMQPSTLLAFSAAAAHCSLILNLSPGPAGLFPQSWVNPSLSALLDFVFRCPRPYT